MEEKRTGDRDFIKGLLTGILIALTFVLAFILFRYGTFGKRKGSGAAALTAGSTREKLEMVASIIDESALEAADEEELVTYLFKGAAAGLDDPYAAYYSAEEMEDIQRQNAGTYHGIGVVLAQEDNENGVTVLEVYEDSPAWEAGILAEDVLTAVNGEDIGGKTIRYVTDKIGELFDEEEGVLLTFLRGKETLDIQVKAAEVETAKVTGEMISDAAGLVRIPEFDEITVQQFEQTLADLQAQGMTQLVVDVRDDPGGLLDTVVAILDDLLDECVLLTTRTRQGEGERITAKDGTLYEGPIAILVNEMSASASEVFSGVLQHYGKAVVIGAQTYGKGTVQKTYSLRDGSAFKLTTEAYAIAGEEEIDGKGIIPDILVEETGEEAEEEAGEETQAQEDAVLARALTWLEGA